VKDTACVDACDCIHPRKDENGFAEDSLLYIDRLSALIVGRADVPGVGYLRTGIPPYAK
jgi:hypothetical protein